MATRSNIGIVNGDGSVTAIYCHWDGYPEHVGNLLLNHYTDFDIVCELMDLGDLSSLNKNLYCDDNNHSFENPAPGVCVAYGRDRGEKGVESRVFDNIIEFEKFADRTGADYQYLFNDGKWQYRKYNGKWSELTPQVCKVG
jgi:hypothetical protein